MSLRLFASLFAVLIAGVLRADIYLDRGKGNVIAPVRSTQITMDAETVIVEAERRFGGFRVMADFTMRNTTGETISHDVAFPFESAGSASIARDGFRVVLGEDPNAVPMRQISLKVRDPKATPPYSPYDFPAALVWPVTWGPHETKLIRLAFDIGAAEDTRELVNGWQLRYIVRTGALWHGPIGRADITLRLDGHRHYADGFAKPKLPDKACYSYPANAKRVSPSEIVWHFENWTPDEDIWLGVLRWDGLYRTHNNKVVRTTPPYVSIETPHPYRGATSDYTEELLDSLTASVLAPWRSSFPNEVERDRPAIKAHAAEWLYQEILARNGETFYLGHDIRESKRPPGSFTAKGITYSVWRLRFLYANAPWKQITSRPGRGPHGTVRESDLTEQERKNLKFLKSYFAP